MPLASRLRRRRGSWRLPPWTVQQVTTALSQAVPWSIGWGRLPEVWREARGYGVTVAVLDTGIDANHPDLTGQVLATKDFTGSGRGVYDSQGHGTHVAGTIAAVDNMVGVVGVAPGAKLICGKVLGDDGSGQSDWVAAGIEWAVAQGADVLSLSLGSPEPSPEIQAALAAAVRRGKFVIAAAGNDGLPNSVGYPAAWDELALAVGAIDENGRLANYSSRGRQVDVAAPGTDILSCWPGARYAKISGTSMATPFVSGTVALALSACRQAGRGCPQNQGELLNLVRSTADDAGPSGPDTGFGWGLIDPAGLLEAIRKERPADPPTAEPGEPTRSTMTIHVGGRAVRITTTAELLGAA